MATKIRINSRCQVQVHVTPLTHHPPVTTASSCSLLLATTSSVLEELQELLLFALAEPLPFMSSQNSPRDHLNETNLEMLSPVCPVPVLAVGAPCSARTVRLGHTNPSCLIHSCTGTRSWLEKRGLSHHCQPQHPVLSPCFGQPQLKNQQSLPSAQLYLDGSGQALTSPQRLCTVVFFWHRAVCCGDEIKYLEQEHALPCRDGLLRAQGWAGV